MAVDGLNWVNSLQWQLDVFIHLQIVVCSSVFTCNNSAFILIQEQSLLQRTGRLWKKCLFHTLCLFLYMFVISLGNKNETVLQGFIWGWRCVQLLVNVISVTHPSVRRLFCHPGARDFFSPLKCPAWLWSPLSLLVSLHPGICSPGVNWPGHELDHSLPCCVRLRIISAPPVCLYSLHREKLPFFLPCDPWSATLLLVACRVVILSHRSGGWCKIFKLSVRGNTFGFTKFTCFLRHGTLVQCVHAYTWFRQVSGWRFALVPHTWSWMWSKE